MQFSTSRSALFLTLCVLILAALALPATARDEAPVQVQPAAAGAPAADCAPAAPTVKPAPAAADIPICSAEPDTLTGQLFPTPITQQGPPVRKHYCKCGCGATCTTDADCGAGGSCVAFVTCC